MIVGDLPFADSNITALFESIMKSRYDFPSYVSASKLPCNAACKDFVKKLLVIKPTERMTMELAFSHQWLGGETFLDSSIEDFVHFRPIQESDLDNEILDNMELMGIDRKTVINSVWTGKFNQSAGIYYMLKYQKMNGKSMELETNSFEKPEAPAPDNLKGMAPEIANILFDFQRTAVTPKSPNSRALKDKEAKKTKHLPEVPRNAPKKLMQPQGLMADFINIQKKKKSLATATKILPPLPKDHKITQSKLEAVEPLELPPAIPTTTKFGILTKTNKIPIDESVYAEGLPKDDGPRTIKFAFNCCCHNSLAPDIFFDRVTSILDKNDVIWENDAYMIACEWGDIRFEVEVCRLPRMDTVGLRLKRREGEIWEFKKLTSKITNELSEKLDAP
jgi:serine/threonine protein kinase